MSASADSVATIIEAGCGELARIEPVFAELFDEYGTPPLWQRPASLHTLVTIVMEQKISLESARAVMGRVENLCPEFTPAALLSVSQEQLLAAGVSRMKASYCHSIAEALAADTVNLERLAALQPEEAIRALVAIRGIGPWTAGVYVMMVLCHPDAWATGDRALAVSVKESFALDEVPTYAALDAMAEAWRPWRGSAARLLWNAYLHRRNRA